MKTKIVRTLAMTVAAISLLSVSAFAKDRILSIIIPILRVHVKQSYIIQQNSSASLPCYYICHIFPCQ